MNAFTIVRFIITIISVKKYPSVFSIALVLFVAVWKYVIGFSTSDSMNDRSSPPVNSTRFITDSSPLKNPVPMSDMALSIPSNMFCSFPVSSVVVGFMSLKNVCIALSCPIIMETI